MTYALVLQTISTFTTVIGVGSAVYAAVFARRVHQTVRDIHETVKQQGQPDSEPAT